MPTIEAPKVVETADVQAKPKFYPNYRVLLHNDDEVFAGLVIEALMKHIPKMNEQKAVAIMMQAHQTGVGEVIVCNQEHAEMYQMLLQNEGLTITIEPVDVG